jgi:hypothetical protein
MYVGLWQMLTDMRLAVFLKRIPAPAKTDDPKREWAIEIPAKPRPGGDACEVGL